MRFKGNLADVSSKLSDCVKAPLLARRDFIFEFYYFFNIFAIFIKWSSLHCFAFAMYLCHILMYFYTFYSYAECNCNNHATKCHFDPAVYELTGRVSGGVCDNCTHNTMGRNCQFCKPFFYKHPSREITDYDVCRRKYEIFLPFSLVTETYFQK